MLSKLITLPRFCVAFLAVIAISCYFLAPDTVQYSNLYSTEEIADMEFQYSESALLWKHADYEKNIVTGCSDSDLFATKATAPFRRVNLTASDAFAIAYNCSQRMFEDSGLEFSTSKDELSAIYKKLRYPPLSPSAIAYHRFKVGKDEYLGFCVYFDKIGYVDKSLNIKVTTLQNAEKVLPKSKRPALKQVYNYCSARV